MPEITIKDLRQRHVEDWLKVRRAIQSNRAEFSVAAYTSAVLGFVRELNKDSALDPQRFNQALAQYVQGLLTLEERQGELTQQEMDGVNVRAAARCGWFDELEEGAVGDLYGWEVDQLSTEIVTLYNEAVNVPKN